MGGTLLLVTRLPNPDKGEVKVLRNFYWKFICGWKFSCLGPYTKLEKERGRERGTEEGRGKGKERERERERESRRAN